MDGPSRLCPSSMNTPVNAWVGWSSVPLLRRPRRHRLETPMAAANTLAPVLDPRALAPQLSGKLLIDGALTAARSGKTFAVVNPATGETVAQAALGEKADVDAAIGAAVKAQALWARMVARERGKLLAECGRRLNEHVEELGRLIALETGKALRTESRVEASVLSDVFVFYGGARCG